MWWRLVIDCSYKSFDNCCRQAFTFQMSGGWLTYKSAMCYPKLYRFKICSNFHIQENKLVEKIAFSLELVSLCKKYNFPLLILLHICKLSYFIGYRCLDLSLQMYERINAHMSFVSSTYQHVGPTSVPPILSKYRCASKLHQFAHHWHIR